MKISTLATIFLLSPLLGCGGSHIDEGHLISDEVEVQAGGGGCTPEAITALNAMTEICSESLVGQTDSTKCVEAAEKFKVDYPGVVCNLEKEVIITSQFIDEEILETVKEPLTEKERLIEAGFFDD